MKHETQVSLLRKLFDLRKNGKHQDTIGEVIKLPSQIYTSASILSDEMQTVFKQYPMVAGHANQLRKPGSYLLSDWEKFPFVIVRGDDGKLRAFINACRHRGARLVNSTGDQLKAFVCPYHGWSYALDGTLKSMTRPCNFLGVDKSKCNLRELPVLESNGLIWIHPSFNGDLNLDNYLGDIAEDLVNFDLDKLVTFKKSKRIKNANWKLLLKTYLEGYHVPYLHRNTLQMAFKNGVIAHYENGPNIRLVAARTNLEEAKDIAEENWNILEFASVYYSLFPNTFLIMHPDYVSINMFFPESANRTIWTHEMLYLPENFKGQKGKEALTKRFEFTNDDVFDNEDFAVAEGVQSGIEFEEDEQIIGLEEGLLAIFQENISKAISGKLE
jgi:phenylpropionate dioxygenase-like ring-hydroxylating dioxygenase large terminal subunit